MKTSLICLLTIGLCCTSCSDRQFHGFATGSSLGGILGSSIGGIAGGGRGYDIGTLTGMVAGGAIGVAATRDRSARNTTEPEAENYRRERRTVTNDEVEDDIYYFGKEQPSASSDAAYDSEAMEDVTYSRYPATKGRAVVHADALYIQQVRFADSDGDQRLSSQEHAYLTLIIYNESDRTLYQVAPQTTCDNRRIHISPVASISELRPGQGFRYRAEIAAGNLKDGTALFRVGFPNGKEIQTVKQFRIRTRKATAE